jgi:nucleoid DNA-binding protein
MNKVALINVIAEKVDITQKVATDVLNTVVVGISGALEKGDSVSLIGFGNFKVVDLVARESKNNQTGKKIKIRARKAIKFSIGKNLKDRVQAKEKKIIQKRKIAAKNRPQKNSTIKVEPIRKLKYIKTIKQLLADNTQRLCLFTIGINTNLRASDILRIQVKHVKDLKTGKSFYLTEKKTGKSKVITANKNVVEATRKLLKTKEYQDDNSFLFQGQRGTWTTSYVNALVKDWCKQINLKGNYGSHSLRKTWGYHQHHTFGTDISNIMACFNHSSHKQTFDYLCIQEKVIKNIYLKGL